MRWKYTCSMWPRHVITDNLTVSYLDISLCAKIKSREVRYASWYNSNATPISPYLDMVLTSPLLVLIVGCRSSHYDIYFVTWYERNQVVVVELVFHLSYDVIPGFKCFSTWLDASWFQLSDQLAKLYVYLSLLQSINDNNAVANKNVVLTGCT